MLGVNVNYAFLEGDSSIIPDNITLDDFYQSQHFTKGSLLNLGSGFGYTHTFVIFKKLFLSLTLYGGISLGYTGLHHKDHGSLNSRYGYNANATGRLAFGYNYGHWYVGFSSLNFLMMNKAPEGKNWINVGAGNFRINIARRFSLKKNVKLPGL